MSHVRIFGLSMKKISVVIPSYNEEKSVRLMYDRLNSVFRTHLPQYDYEIIFVDDYSTDGTRGAIRALAGEDKRVKAVFNARNFGFHRNVFSALTYGSGDATFMLFGDLQDPPENLPEFVARWEAGAKVVIGQRRSSDEGFIMTGCRHLYYKLIDWNAYPVGEASRTVGLFLLGSIQLFFIGILGEYILSINGRVVSKPRVVIGERLNFGPSEGPSGLGGGPTSPEAGNPSQGRPGGNIS